MDSLLERLDNGLPDWKPETANDVRQRVVEIIDFADRDALDLLRSRELEQSVVDLLDEPHTGEAGSPNWDLRRRRGRWLFYPAMISIHLARSRFTCL
jgi:hypothetical protein